MIKIKTNLNKQLIIFFFFLSVSVAYSQLSFSDTLISFGAVQANIQHSRILTITNNTDHDVEIYGSGFTEQNFSIDGNPSFVEAGGQLQLTIKFFTNHNIYYNDFVIMDYSGTQKPQVVTVSAQGVYSDSYYMDTRNKWGEELKSALNNIIDNHTSLGYTIARDKMYGSIDNKNGIVECVYTGRTASFNTRAGATSNSFNCEHTWPQSFFDKDEPMRSDIFHLYPTDIDANSRRGSYDFGLVNNVTWQEGGSKLGPNSQGQIVFEPRDEHKGNVARSHFYFLSRYGSRYSNYENKINMEDLFRLWHESDAVDEDEQARNDAISNFQKNRNPFIDHPEFVDRIPAFFDTGDPQSIPQVAVWPKQISLDTVGLNQTITKRMAIVNTGSAVLDIYSIGTGGNGFSVNPASAQIEEESYSYFDLVFSAGSTSGTYRTEITIDSNDPVQPQIKIPVQAEVNGTVGISHNAGSSIRFSLHQNYPNPFNPDTNISFSLEKSGPVDLFVYNTRGQLIQKIIQNRILAAGRHSYLFSGRYLTSGIYYYRLTTGGNSLTKSSLLIK